MPHRSLRSLIVLSFAVSGCSPAASAPALDGGALGMDSGAVERDSGAVVDSAAADAAAPDAAAPDASHPCSPRATCTRVGDCLAEVDQTGAATPTLRVAQLAFAAPRAWSAGVVGGTLRGAFMPNAATCNLNGGGTANWLFEVTGGATGLTMGGARPLAAGMGPYTLIDETIGSLVVAPVSTALSSGATGGLTSAPFDVVLPIFLDAGGTQAILFPLSELVVSMTPDASLTCVGSYNAVGLDPANSCLPDATHPAFLDGGQLVGLITLEDADTIPVEALAQSLCVLLSEDPATYGDGAAPLQHCRRDPSGQIELMGDWCAATNAAATDSCHDAMRVEATFAAAGASLTP